MERVADAEPDRLADLLATGDAGQILQFVESVNGVLPDIAAVQRLGGNRAADGGQQLFHFAIQQQHVTAVAKVAKNHLIAHRLWQKPVRRPADASADYRDGYPDAGCALLDAKSG